MTPEKITIEINADMRQFNSAIKKATKAARELSKVLYLDYRPKWWQFWLWFRPIHFHIHECANETNQAN